MRFASTLLAKFTIAIAILFLIINFFSCTETWASDSDNRITVAFALGGGGTRGLAHIGVLKVLTEEGIPIDAIAGTSMGALVGGLYCAGLSPRQIEEIFKHKTIVRAYDTVPIPLRLALIPVFLVPHLFGYHPYDGLYRGNKFAKYISSLAPEGKKDLENLKPKFWAIAANLLDGEAYAIKTGNLGRAVQASSAVPALRRPLPWQGGLLVDGGVIENIPTEHAMQMGCDFVVAVDVDDRVLPVTCERFRKIGSVSNRALDMNLQKLDEKQIAIADAVIHPDLLDIRLLSRKRKDVKKAIDAGVEAARFAIPYLKTQLAEAQSHKDEELKAKQTEPDKASSIINPITSGRASERE
jgi:NTE family protein